MKLIWSSASPFARKVLVVAHELELGDRIETVSGTGTPVAPATATREANPLSKLPSLMRDDGPPIYDSAVICQYLCSIAADGDSLLPASGEARWSTLTLEALGDGICEAAILVRYEIALREEAMRSDDWVGAQMNKVDGALDALDTTALVEGFSLGHAAVGCALGYLDLRFPEKDWRTGRDRLAAWYETFLARDSAKATEPSA